MKNQKRFPISGAARAALCLLAASAVLHADANIRVHAGGSAYTDGAGNVWAADYGSNGGSTFGTGNSIANTSDPALYQTERYGNGTLEYTFNVSNGNYTVKLKFAEIYFTASGQRVFNIVINGNTVQANFDIVAAAGGPFTAVDVSYPVTATAGNIDIQLVPVVQNSKISAIEIDPVPVTASSSVSFADQETPAGPVNGNNAAFTLAHAPNPSASLILVRNGLVLKPGADYGISGNTITFAASAVPQTGDSLQAFYRY